MALHYLPIGLKIYIYTLTFIFGLIMGSFLHCLAWRIVTDENIAKGRSHCPNCQHVLSPIDLIPVVSYLIQKGKCRYCQTKISLRYPLTELVTGLVYIGIFHHFGFDLKTLEFLILFSLLLICCFTDLIEQTIPDLMVLLGIINYFVFLIIFKQNLITGILNGLSVSLPLFLFIVLGEKLLKKELMGGGDIKILFMCGLYFSWQQNVLILILACFIGIIFGLIWERLNTNKLFPFAPSIVLATYLVVLYGQPLVNWYISLF